MKLISSSSKKNKRSGVDRRSETKKRIGEERRSNTDRRTAIEKRSDVKTKTITKQYKGKPESIGLIVAIILVIIISLAGIAGWYIFGA